MTANQLSRRISRLFPSQAAASRALGISDSRLNHYIKGRRPVPEFVGKMLDCIEGKKSTLR
jgi:DNA-binding transcriptional regulator YdaS (Cro superfamily)